MKYVENGAHSAVELDGNIYQFESTSVDRSTLKENIEQKNIGLEWDDRYITLDSYKVFPNGDTNQLPREIRGMFKNNPIGTRVMKKRKFLTWGTGPALYRFKYTDGIITKEWLQDPDIHQWLMSWNYRAYLRRVIEDFNKSEGQYSKAIKAKGHRIGRPSFIARIEHIPAAQARLATLMSNPQDEPDLVIVGEWDNRHKKNFKVYPLLDEDHFDRHEVSVHFSYEYKFDVKNYPVPDSLSVRPWMNRSSAVPFILENFVAHNLTIRWHIKIPQAYWDSKEVELKKIASEKGTTYKVQHLIDYKKKVKFEISEILAGEQNTGKYVTTEVIKQVLADRHIVTHEWEFIPIDQKIKDFVDANLAISDKADGKTSAGLGMHQALSNISSDGKSDSGSEQLYAMRNFDASEVAIPEEIICDTINRAIAINWPDKDVKIGFHRNSVVREQDVTPKERVGNDSTSK